MDDALTCGNDLFYDSVIVPLLSQFSISKIEHSSFKFLGMCINQTADFAVSLAQDTKSIKDLPLGVDSLKEEEKQSVLKSLVWSVTLPRLDSTGPHFFYLRPHCPLPRPLMKDSVWLEHY